MIAPVDNLAAGVRRLDRPKVFGIGWAKTGTTTLGRCFELLGFARRSQNLSLVPALMHGDWTRTLHLAAQHESFEDWPWIRIYRELDAAFPGSRFVLTRRDPAAWLESYRAMLAGEGPPAPALAAIRDWLYGLSVADASDAELLARVRQHDADVQAWFADRPGDLLVVDWARGDGWEALCAFLDLPIPEVPFPHLNRRPSG